MLTPHNRSFLQIRLPNRSQIAEDACWGQCFPMREPTFFPRYNLCAEPAAGPTSFRISDYMTTSLDLDALRIRFSKDIEAISQALIDAFGLKHEQEEIGLKEPSLRWLNPVFSLIMTPRGIAIFEEKSNQAWVLSEQKYGGQKNGLTRLAHLFTPAWVMTRLNNSAGTTP